MKTQVFFANVASVLIFAMVIACGCGNGKISVETVSEASTDEVTPTGYPSGEIQRACFMYNEKVYLNQSETKSQLPEGSFLVGEIESVDNVNNPSRDFEGARVEIGQKIYSSRDGEVLYLQYEEHYREFKVEQVSIGKSPDEETDTMEAQTEEKQAEENPINTDKEILYYLMWTSDEKLKNDVTAMKMELELSADDIEAMRQIGLKQYLANKEADKQYRKDGDVEKFNETAHLNAVCAREELQQLLGDKYEVFLEWIAVWWEEEREYRESKW